MRVAAAIVLLALQLPPRPPDLPFRIHAIDPGASETAAVADINRDGRLDIVSGEHWYEAPSWTKHRFQGARLQQSVHRQLQRPAGRRRRRWLPGRRVGVVVREEGGVVEEPGQGRPVGRLRAGSGRKPGSTRASTSSSPSSRTSTTTAGRARSSRRRTGPANRVRDQGRRVGKHVVSDRTYGHASAPATSTATRGPMS